LNLKPGEVFRDLIMAPRLDVAAQLRGLVVEPNADVRSRSAQVVATTLGNIVWKDGPAFDSAISSYLPADGVETVVSPLAVEVLSRVNACDSVVRPKLTNEGGESWRLLTRRGDVWMAI
jgi:hypothetical protein